MWWWDSVHSRQIKSCHCASSRAWIPGQFQIPRCSAWLQQLHPVGRGQTRTVSVTENLTESDVRFRVRWNTWWSSGDAGFSMLKLDGQDRVVSYKCVAFSKQFDISNRMKAGNDGTMTSSSWMWLHGVWRWRMQIAEMTALRRAHRIQTVLTKSWQAVFRLLAGVGFCHY